MVKTAKFFLFLVLSGTLISSVGLSGSSFYISQVLAESTNLTQTTPEENNEANVAKSESIRGEPNSRTKESIPESKSDTIKTNHQPRAHAGSDIVVNEKDNVILNAQKSTDPDGEKLSYSWSQISPKSPRVDLKDVSARTSFEAPEIDTKYAIFTFLLTVEDGQGSKSRDMVKVKVVGKHDLLNETPSGPDQVNEQSTVSKNNNEQSKSEIQDKPATQDRSKLERQAIIEIKKAIIKQKQEQPEAVNYDPRNETNMIATDTPTETSTTSGQPSSIDSAPRNIKVDTVNITSTGTGRGTTEPTNESDSQKFTNATLSNKSTSKLVIPKFSTKALAPPPEGGDGGFSGSYTFVGPAGSKEFGTVQMSGPLLLLPSSPWLRDNYPTSLGEYVPTGTWQVSCDAQFNLGNGITDIIVPVNYHGTADENGFYTGNGHIEPGGSNHLILTENSPSQSLISIGLNFFVPPFIRDYDTPACGVPAPPGPLSIPQFGPIQHQSNGDLKSAGVFTGDRLDWNGPTKQTIAWDIIIHPSVKNPFPVAEAGIVSPPQYPNGITYSNAGQQVTLDGSKSHSESTGISIQKYEWSKIEGPADTPMTLQEVKPTFDFPVIDPMPPNDVKVSYSLKVIDSNGGVSTNSAVATVHLNHPPDPVIVATPTPPVPQLTKVTLDGSQSKDIDVGDQISYNWTQDDADPIRVVLSNPTGSITEFTAPENETSLLFHLNVKDRSESESTSFKSIEVKCSAQSTAPACSKPTLKVEVNKQEINPYPVNINPPKPQAEITVTTKKLDGTPATNIQVEVKACTEVGSVTDGHTHDVNTADACFHSTRPKAVLDDGVQNGNPIVTTTDDTGIAKITYNSPSSQNNYYISGKDKIIATLKQDSTVKDDTKTITTKVPNLKQMSNSLTCPGGTETYYFEAQSNHKCLFFGTQSANTELVQLAKNFHQRQIDCSIARNPRADPACDVTPSGSKTKEFVIVQGNPIPIKITAMALPWGGLLDISGNWKPSHFTHNDGNNVDVGFNIKGTVMSIDQKKLLRDVILDNGQLLPYANEGKEDDVSKATNHFHIQFTGTMSCPIGTLGTIKLSASETNLCQSNEYNIKLSSFIPANNIEAPPQFRCSKPDGRSEQLYLKGDSRDYDPASSSFRTRQVVTVLTGSDADGVKDGTSPQNLLGVSKAYAIDALINGKISPEAINDHILNDCHLLHLENTASIQNMHITVDRISDKKISVHIFGGSGLPFRPLVPLTDAPDIDWDFTILIDESGSIPKWKLLGTHDGFPAYEIYINDKRIYGYSPGPGPYSKYQIFSLFPPMDIPRFGKFTLTGTL